MNNDFRAVSTKTAPEAIGPYSQAVICENLVFCSGQIALDPATGEFVEGGVEHQTTQVLVNLRAVLKEAGSSLDKVLRCDVFLADMAEFGKMNQVYSEFFQGEIKPARQAVEASALPRGALVEISCIARK